MEQLDQALRRCFWVLGAAPWSLPAGELGAAFSALLRAPRPCAVKGEKPPLRASSSDVAWAEPAFRLPLEGPRAGKWS